MSIASGFLALACASTLSAAVETHDVSFDGSMEYTSIQDAINAASDGDIIYIHPGYYQEALNTNGKNVSLHGKVDEDAGNWPVLYGPGNGKSILTVANGETQEMEVSSLVFFGGFSGWGPAVNIYGASPRFLDCVFENNWGSVLGGAVSCHHSEASFLRCSFKKNYCGSFGGAVYLKYSPVHFTLCVFYDNYVGGFGGAVYVNHLGGPPKRPSMLGCMFVQNIAQNTPPQIRGGWNNLGFNCFAWTNEDLDQDGLPDGCEQAFIDMNGDGVIDGQDAYDIINLIADPGSFEPEDFDGNGIIDGHDFTIMLLGWW